MHLLSCKNPKRIYNKYSNEYVWVPCGECSICKNRRAAHYTALLEREKLQHPYCFFVTLTYDEDHLPVLRVPDFVERVDFPGTFESSRSRDNICVSFEDLFPHDKIFDYTQADIDFFKSWIQYGGLPIVSKSDVQLFLKRLNKYAHDHYTSTFKNFRYFIVSEYGSTTFRSHYHAIFYVDNSRFAEGFKDSVSACWKYGINDTQPVENSACGYVSQYLNKFSDMPYVYKNKSIRPFFLCSRNPFIGALSECSQNDTEIVNNSVVTQIIRRSSHATKFDVVPLEQSYQNRLFPKCPDFKSISDTLRTQFYTIYRRFSGKTLRSFLSEIYDYMTCSNEMMAEYFRLKLNFNKFAFPWSDPLILFDEYSFNWLRRLYYFGRKVARQACQFGLSIIGYVRKILDYYNNKELYLLKSQYEFEQEVSQVDCDSLALVYPEFLFSVGISISDYIVDMQCFLAQEQIANADYLAFSNKKSHFKNAYLDSLRLKSEARHLYNIIKTYLYAKKCNETLEAFAA